MKAPLIDKRTADCVAQQTLELMRRYMSEAAPGWPTGAALPQTGPNTALIRVFARYCELVIERLNQAPDKNWLALLDLLGHELQPPQPARAPLTFTLSAGRRTPVLVPAGVRAAATGEQTAVIFTTDEDLSVSSLTLDQLWLYRPEEATLVDYRPALSAPGLGPQLPQPKPLAPALYLAHDLLASPALQSLALIFTTPQPQADFFRQLTWQWWDASTQQWTEISATVTTPLANQCNIDLFTSPPKSPFAPVTLIAGDETSHRCWLRCGLPATVASPNIAGITLEGALAQRSELPEKVFADEALLAKPYYPFGAQPARYDAFYLASSAVFGRGGATVTLHFTITSSPPPQASGVQLAWECWNGNGWQSVDALNDGTGQLTKSGTVEITLPPVVAQTRVNGVNAHWLRVRLVDGHYGQPAGYKTMLLSSSGVLVDPDNATEPGLPTVYVPVPATFAPPQVSELTLDLTLPVSAAPAQAWLASAGQFQPFAPGTPLFTPRAETKPTLYWGFNWPGDAPLPTTTLTLYLRITEQALCASSRVAPTWEYHTPQGWRPLTVTDDTGGLMNTGLLRWLPPSDWQRHCEFGAERAWIRLCAASTDDGWPPLTLALLNTVMATQVVTINREILGSGNGAPDQRVYALRPPVLSGETLAVREPWAKPVVGASTDEQTPDAQWVSWQGQRDFHGSTGRDRHYVLNRLTGEITFGDNVHGRTPPVGAGNLRLTYRTGGGAAGNVAANIITQLQSTLPYIHTVANPVAAEGGAEAETDLALLRRASRQVRHGDRCVTSQDYEDLARQASAAVARVHCVSLVNLAQTPQASGLPPGPLAPGQLSIIVTPSSTVAQPQPSQELLAQVQGFLAARAPATARFTVRGPIYVPVNVTVAVVVTLISAADQVKQAMFGALAAFLHPLNGGPAGAGWGFGELPHRSQIFAALKGITGVDHVTAVTLAPDIDDPHFERDGDIAAGHFLICSGEHCVNIVS